MRISDRRLSHIDPCKVWIKPFTDARYRVWPPPHRGSNRPGAGTHDGGDIAGAVQDNLDDLPVADAESEDDPEEVAMQREVDTLLRDGLAALRANNAQGNQGGDEDGQPDRSPQSSGASDESSSDSDNNAAGDDPACDRAAPAVAHLKGTADAFFVLPGDNGIIRYYNNSKQFTAECKCGHQKCIKTRQSTEAASVATSKKPSHNALAKGRPLGYLTAWLLDGHNHESKAAHWAQENEILATTFDKRLAAREILKANATAADLLSSERPRRHDEAEEPTGLV